MIEAISFTPLGAPTGLTVLLLVIWLVVKMSDK